jgi:hypothetical protein
MSTTLRVETAIGDFELTTAFGEMGDYIEVKELFSDKIIGNIAYQDLEDLDANQTELLENRLIELFEEAF